MKEKLEQILANLKAIGVSVSKVETDLGFSNGLLGKVKNGKSNLSDEKFGLVESYYKNMVGDKIHEIAKEIETNHPQAIITPKEEETTTFQGFVELVNPQPEPPKVVLPKAKGIMLGADYLADTPKTTFQKLLIEFNSLIDEQPPIKQVEAKLYELIEKSQHHDLNARQSEAIRSRCINYLTGQYGKKKQS